MSLKASKVTLQILTQAFMRPLAHQSNLTSFAQLALYYVLSSKLKKQAISWNFCLCVFLHLLDRHPKQLLPCSINLRSCFSAEILFFFLSACQDFLVSNDDTSAEGVMIHGTSIWDWDNCLKRCVCITSVTVLQNLMLWKGFIDSSTRRGGDWRAVVVHRVALLINVIFVIYVAKNNAVRCTQCLDEHSSIGNLGKQKKRPYSSPTSATTLGL